MKQVQTVTEVALHRNVFVGTEDFEHLKRMQGMLYFLAHPQMYSRFRKIFSVLYRNFEMSVFFILISYKLIK